jgi:cation diffusion facilitator family transporter
MDVDADGKRMLGEPLLADAGSAKIGRRRTSSETKVIVNRPEIVTTAVARSGARSLGLSLGLSAASEASGEVGELSRRVHSVSLAVNVLLFAVKLWVYLQSQALVVLAALIDSAVDLLAQVILMGVNRMTTSKEPSQVVLYPAGRSRAEPVGVIACALVMAMASAQVIRDSAVVLVNWWRTDEVHLVQITLSDQLILGGTILMKLALYLYCRRNAHANVTVEAVAQDHLNDVLSNSGALAAAVATQISGPLWLADPVGAILISVYIIWSWVATGMEQLDLIVGRTADPAFLDLVREMAETHDPAASLDLVRAYHWGPRFLVEIEIIMGPNTPLAESHDVGIMLQHKIERLEQVDRCFVHIDYMARETDDHDPHTPLAYKVIEAQKGQLPPRPSLERRASSEAAVRPDSRGSV